MILTPIPPHVLPDHIERLAQAVSDHPLAARVVRRIAGSMAGQTFDQAAAAARHAQAVALCQAFGLTTIDEAPQQAFSWDGRAVRTRSEPDVLIHELAHWQVCAPARRSLPDFGLGAGPETGRRDEAEAAQRLFGIERDVEEGMCSLLGILWEAELGQPALLAWLEQNWMEGVDRRENRGHLLKMIALLNVYGLLDQDGRPTWAARSTGDDDGILAAALDPEGPFNFG